MPFHWRRYLRWLRWRGQKRNRSRDAQVLGLVLLVVALDQWSKHTLKTAEWAWHKQPPSWGLYACLMLAVVALLLRSSTYRWGAAAFIAGGLGNVISWATSPAIANPIQIQTDRGTTAFNVADVAATVGTALLIATAFVHISRIVIREAHA